MIWIVTLTQVHRLSSEQFCGLLMQFVLNHEVLTFEMNDFFLKENRLKVNLFNNLTVYGSHCPVLLKCE